MHVYILAYDVEGRTKMYFSTTKTNDKILATLEVAATGPNVDVAAIIEQTGFFYPKKSIYKPEKSAEQKRKETLELEAEAARLRTELAGFMYGGGS